MLFKVELEVPMLDAKCPTLSSIASFFFFFSILRTLFPILKPCKGIIFKSPSLFIIFYVCRYQVKHFKRSYVCRKMIHARSCGGGSNTKNESVQAVEGKLFQVKGESACICIGMACLLIGKHRCNEYEQYLIQVIFDQFKGREKQKRKRKRKGKRPIPPT